MAEKTKDVWDKLDVLGKMFSGVILAIIALVLKIGSDNIATSMQTADLVRSLITDLTTKEERTRQDIALIALNNAVGERNSRLVADIAERIFLDLNADQATGSIAFQILEQRDPERAEKIQEQLIPDSLTRKQIISNPEGVETPAAQQAEENPQAQWISRAFRQIVYIQYSNEANRQLMEKLRKNLRENNLFVPGVDQVSGKFSNSIRYFHPEDRLLAQKAAALIENFFAKEGVEMKVKLQDFSKADFKAPRGQIEAWINLEH